MIKEKISIGLDVGNYHINMVKLAGNRESRRLLGFSNVKLKLKQDREEKLRQIEKIAQEEKISAYPINIGISGESVIVRYIDLPKMSKEEVKKALKYEAQQYIPFKIEEVISDFHILGPLSSDSNRIKVLLVAAKKQEIVELIELIQKAGLQPNLIDINSFSLINCFLFNGPEIKDTYALINIEFDLVNINILQKDMPFFTRDIFLGEEDILPLRQQENREDRLFEMGRPLWSNLIREISLSIDYFESEFEKQVGVIYLSGQGAKIAKLIEFFGSQLGRKINLWNPVQNLIVDSAHIDADRLKENACMLALACGLALRG